MVFNHFLFLQIQYLAWTPSVLLNISSNSQSPIMMRHCVSSIDTENMNTARKMIPHLQNFRYRHKDRKPTCISVKILHPICHVQ